MSSLADPSSAFDTSIPETTRLSTPSGVRRSARINMAQNASPPPSPPQPSTPPRSRGSRSRSGAPPPSSLASDEQEESAASTGSCSFEGPATPSRRTPRTRCTSSTASPVWPSRRPSYRLPSPLSIVRFNKAEMRCAFYLVLILSMLLSNLGLWLLMRYRYAIYGPPAPCELRSSTHPFPQSWGQKFSILRHPISSTSLSPSAQAELESLSARISTNPRLLNNCILPQSIIKLPLVTCQDRLPWYNLTSAQTLWLNERTFWSYALDAHITGDFNAVFGTTFDFHELQTSWMLAAQGPSNAALYEWRRCEACHEMRALLSRYETDWPARLFEYARGLMPGPKAAPLPRSQSAKLLAVRRKLRAPTALTNWTRSLRRRLPRRFWDLHSMLQSKMVVDAHGRPGWVYVGDEIFETMSGEDGKGEGEGEGDSDGDGDGESEDGLKDAGGYENFTPAGSRYTEIVE